MSRPSDPPDAVVRYAEHEDGILDVHLPAGPVPGPRPLVFYVHGGVWRPATGPPPPRPAPGARPARGGPGPGPPPGRTRGRSRPPWRRSGTSSPYRSTAASEE